MITMIGMQRPMYSTSGYEGTNISIKKIALTIFLLIVIYMLTSLVTGKIFLLDLPITVILVMTILGKLYATPEEEMVQKAIRKMQG